MTDLFNRLKQIEPEVQNKLYPIEFLEGLTANLYPNSINFEGDACYFIGKKNGDKYFWVLHSSNDTHVRDFQGESISLPDDSWRLIRCPLNHHNAALLRDHFDFCRPKLIGLDNSFGFGDRLGNANPAHIRAVIGSGMKPVLAQQSIRELQRTHRTPEEVLDAATWAVFQEGYKDGYGADADHLKTTDDIDLMSRSGYTFFTIDPSEYVVNEADSLPVEEIERRVQSLSWELMGGQVENFISRYSSQDFTIHTDFVLQPHREEVLRGLLKYGGVIAHTVKLYRYLKDTYPNHPSEVELSVDETESVTSPFEHFLVANELRRHDVRLVSLAPRFVGDFEKGIDYKGDVKQFKSEYIKHVKIAEKLGPYKISFHSGSDKFTVYQAVGLFKQGRVHIKTAGTSYLEALKTIAMEDPALFREILRFSKDNYETEKRTYHVSARVENLPDIDKTQDGELVELFEQNDVRQILHVNFGKVLTTKDENDAYLFRNRIMDCLKENEETYYRNLQIHFRRHLQPFRPAASQRRD